MASPLYFFLLASLVVDQAYSIRVDLNHIDSGKSLTQLERLKRDVERSKQRAQGFRAMKGRPVNAGSQVTPGNGAYLMTIAIGTPPQEYPAIADTGSDLIWTQCDPCLSCFTQPTSIFDPMKSSSFKNLPCSTGLCKALPGPVCYDSCWYTYTYGDSSYTTGYMGTETFTLGGTGKRTVSVRKVGFGCGISNGGTFTGEASGLVGLGRGPLSLVSQLDEKKFSYCLTNRETNDTSYLLLGSGADSLPKGEKVTTPLIKNPMNPSFYYVIPNGVRVNGVVVPLPPAAFVIDSSGNGGMIVDSGTTLFLLETGIYQPVADALNAKISLAPIPLNIYGLEYCYEMSNSTKGVEFPTLELVFGKSKMVLRSENYFFQVPGGVCLGLSEAEGFSILGNVPQQNYFVSFDVGGGKISFVSTNCGKA